MAVAALALTPGEALKRVRHEGWVAALNSILASLKDYPNTGGDINIRAEVERVRREAQIEILLALETTLRKSVLPLLSLPSSEGTAEGRPGMTFDEKYNARWIENAIAELAALRVALAAKDEYITILQKQRVGYEEKIANLESELRTAKRDGAIEALEKLPCGAKGRFDADCMEVENLPLDLWCPRCKALKELRNGGK